MTDRVHRYFARNTNAWRRKGRADVLGAILDGFSLGITEPTTTNSGVLSSVTRSDYTGSTTIAGGTQTSPVNLTSLNFLNPITLSGGYYNFYNCYFSSNQTTGTGNGQVTCTAAGVQRANFDRCTFKPTTPTFRTNSIQGHHFTAYRCLFQDVVDGLSPMNLNGTDTSNRLDVYVRGCYLGGLGWWADDAGIHTDGTHNDIVQVHAGYGFWFEGNTVWGYKNNIAGSPALDSSANNLYPQVGQGILVQNTAGRVGDIHITKNFIYGTDTMFKFNSLSGSWSSGNYYSFDVELKNNTFMDDNQRIYGGAHTFYHIRPDNNIVLNGVQYTGGSVQLNTDNNIFSNATSVLDSSRRGTAVKIRVDTSPTPQ